MGLLDVFKNIGRRISGKPTISQEAHNNKIKERERVREERELETNLSRVKQFPYTTSTGNTYNTPFELAMAKNKATSMQSLGERAFRSAMYKYSPEGRLGSGEYRLQNINNQKEYDEEYRNKNTSSRGFVDRLLGMLGYQGVTQGLYNLYDDNSRTTFTEGLKEGLKYTNPFTDDVSSRKFMSDVFELDKAKPLKYSLMNSVIPGSGSTSMVKEFARDVYRHNNEEIPYQLDKNFSEKIPETITALTADIALDPLTYTTGVFTAPAKVLKGSGKTLEAINTIKSVKNFRTNVDVAKFLKEERNATSNLYKISLHTNIPKEEAIKAVEGNEMWLGRLDRNTGELLESTEEIAERLQKEWYGRINHAISPDSKLDGVTVGFKSSPYNSFEGKRVKHLRKEIISDRDLRYIGDRTVAPYFNSLLKKMRLNEVSHKVLKGYLNHDLEYIAKDRGELNSFKHFIIEKAKGTTNRASLDGIVFNNAMAIKDVTDRYSQEDVLKFIDAYEKGDFKALKNINILKDTFIPSEVKRTANRAKKFYDKRLKLNGAPTEEELKKLHEFFLNDSVTENPEILDGAVKALSENNYDNLLFYNLTGKMPSKTLSPQEMLDGHQLVKLFKSITNWSEELKDIPLSKYPMLDRVKRESLKGLSNYDVVKMIVNDGDLKNRVISHLQSGWRHLHKYSYTLGDVTEVSKYIDEGISKYSSELDSFFTRDMIKNMEEIERLARTFNYETDKPLYSALSGNLITEAYNIIKHQENVRRVFNKRVENAEKVPQDVKDIFDMIERHMGAIGEQDIIRGVLRPKQFETLKGKYLPHYELLDEEAMRSLIGKNKNGEYQPNVIGVKRSFDKARVKGSTIANSKGKLDDALHNIYMSRILQSNQYALSYDIQQFIDKNFTNGYVKNINDYNKLDKEVYTPAAQYHKINDLFKFKAVENYNRELKNYLNEVKNSIHKDPLKYGITYSKDKKQLDRVVSSYIKQYERNMEDFTKQLDEGILSEDSYNKLSEMVNERLSMFSEFVDDKYKTLMNSYEMKVKHILDRAASKFADENIEDKLVNVYKGYKNKFFEFADDSKYAEVTFGRNVPLQKLNYDQINMLNSLGIKNTEKRAIGDYSDVMYHENHRVPIMAYENNVFERTNELSYTQNVMLQSSFLNFYDSMLYHWKINNTLTAPSFHVLNATSNAFQSFLAVGALALQPKRMRQAVEILKNKDPRKIYKFGGKKYTGKELANIAKASGAVNESFASHDFGTKINTYFENNMRATGLQTFKNVKEIGASEGVPEALKPLSKAYNKVLAGSTVIGTNIETTQRMNLFLAALDEGYSIHEASDVVNKFLFDYGELSNFEKGVMKRILPFYTFMRKNFPLQIEQMLKAPQIYRNYNYGVKEFEMSGDDYVPENKRNEWRQDYIQIPNTGYGINMQFPHQQIERFFDVDKMAGMLSPAIKAPVELINGEYVYTGFPIRRNEYVGRSKKGEPVSKEYKQTPISRSMLEYLASQFRIPSSTMRFINNKKDDRTLTSLSEYGFIPIAKVRDNTVNPHPLYDENGNYIKREK